ncbi:MAG: hypothetical protein DWP92_02550 [Armatimonadetes bacterium]|nr:MAG: hypothetical protein DWP92_02550 [Armatimonadota bacterium]
MGQRIEVDSTTVVDDTAVFATNRSLTGTDGEGFASSEEASSSETFPAKLASELFEADQALTRVYVDQNMLVVGRGAPWDDQSKASTAKLIEDFFLFYPEG